MINRAIIIQVDAYSKLNTSVDRHDFMSSPVTADTWYQPWYNSITIPAGILHAPVYRRDFPNAVNFGSLGCMGAHATAHGGDDQGIQVFASVSGQTWMYDQSASGFGKMRDCGANQ